jgi:basic membrane lipoprotein Med (substrate-binding protein (PBP1-ABC) superfamily)
VLSSRRTRSIALVVVAVVALVATTVLLLRRSDPMDWSARHAAPHAKGELAAGFNAPDVKSYYSSQVINPGPETWTKVRPSADYRVLLLAAGKDADTAYDPQVKILVDAVHKWAADEHRIKLKVRYLSDPDSYIQELDDAAKSDNADLIVTAGNDLVAPVAVVSANYAGYNPQQFLVLGAEVAEPTTNIAATDWAGSAYLGEDLDQSLYYDPTAVTAPRAYAALRAGAAAILSGYTSVIVRIPADKY